MRNRKFGLKKTILFSVLFIVAGIGVSMYEWTSAIDDALVAQNQAREIVYPVQYSDQHITENAIVSDPRFKNIAVTENLGLLANILSSVQGHGNKAEYKSEPPERGTWVWTPLFEITPDYRDSIISGAKENGMRNIYLSIDSYLDIYTLADGAQKQKKKKNFDDALEKFITQAHKNGMTVDAEAGWRNWAEPGHEYKAFAVLEYAIDYNKTHAEKLRGFQYDIEPYILPQYKEDKKSVLRRFVALVRGTVVKLGDSDLGLSVVIPEFYDSSKRATPKYFYGLRYSYTFDHLLNILDGRSGSKIIVMAYRNFAEGKDGAIEISKNEIDTAGQYQTKIIVAQETGNVLPARITFHNTSRSYYDEQLKIIDETFAGEKSYGGLSTHYINALLALK
ncbi:MAG: hypothetical protein Q7S75_01470 [bacterium]|nr:hypothetical protein [bacterium]